MCYRVVVASRRCSKYHPVSGSGRICYRQCRDQAKFSSSNNTWNRICDRLTKTLVAITILAEVTVVENDCPVCVAIAQDLDLRSWRESHRKLKQEIEEMTQLLREHRQELNEMMHENVDPEDPRFVQLDRSIDSYSTDKSRAMVNSSAFEDWIFNREDFHTVENDRRFFDQAQDDFDRSGAQSLPFFYHGVGEAERCPEEHLPCHSPDRDDILGLFEDELWIVPSHVNL